MALIFLKLDGIQGAGVAENFQGWIDLQSFAFSGNSPASQAFGSGFGAGKVTLSPISIVKQPDIASPHLFLSMCAGTHMATGTLVVIARSGQQPSLRLDVTEVFVTSFVQRGSGEAMSEEVSLSYRTLQYTQSVLNAAGQTVPGVSAGWNIATNSKM